MYNVGGSIAMYKISQIMYEYSRMSLSDRKANANKVKSQLYEYIRYFNTCGEYIDADELLKGYFTKYPTVDGI